MNICCDLVSDPAPGGLEGDPSSSGEDGKPVADEEEEEACAKGEGRWAISTWCWIVSQSSVRE